MICNELRNFFIEIEFFDNELREVNDLILFSFFCDSGIVYIEFIIDIILDFYYVFIFNFRNCGKEKRYRRYFLMFI